MDDGKEGIVLFIGNFVFTRIGTMGHPRNVPIGPFDTTGIEEGA